MRKEVSNLQTATREAGVAEHPIRTIQENPTVPTGRPLHIVRVICLGKESSHLSEVQLGLMDADRSYTIYDGVPGPEYDNQLQAAVRGIPLSWFAKTTGISERSMRYIRNGHAAPRPRQRAKLWAAVERWGVIYRQKVTL